MNDWLRILLIIGVMIMVLVVLLEVGNALEKSYAEQKPSCCKNQSGFNCDCSYIIIDDCRDRCNEEGLNFFRYERHLFTRNNCFCKDGGRLVDIGA